MRRMMSLLRLSRSASAKIASISGLTRFSELTRFSGLTRFVRSSADARTVRARSRNALLLPKWTNAQILVPSFRPQSRAMKLPWGWLVAAQALALLSGIVGALTCGPSYKEEGGKCVMLSNDDVVRGVHGLVYPKQSTCKKVHTAQNIEVCEDNLPKECVVWSVVASQWCNHYGSIEFEKQWASKGCKVTLFHYVPYFKGNTCALPEGPLEGSPNLSVVRNDVWGGRCFACFYKVILKHLALVDHVDVLKIQTREGVAEDFDGIQLTMLADLFLHTPEVARKINQITWTLSINTNTLVDTVGREGEHAWNMWGAERFLSQFAAFRNEPTRGPSRLLPVQFDHFLDQAEVSSTLYSYYHQSYLRIPEGTAHVPDTWRPRPPSPLRAAPPAYCTVPSREADEALQDWVAKELRVRCHPTRLWVPCVRDRTYDPILPCPAELMGTLAEDYAVSRNWCDFALPAARVPELQVLDAETQKQFRLPRLGRGAVRAAFFFTVYTDAAFVRRLLDRLYSAKHYYLLHIDASSTDQAFEDSLRAMARERNAAHPQGGNVFLAKDLRIVYGASTATMLLTRAMAWFHRHASGWDYFVPVTGSDYPLIPLARLEKILAFQQPPMPFVMAWTPGTSTHLFRLQKTHPVFEENPLLVRSIKAVTNERGAVLGAVPMEYRSNNFGPPLLCNQGASFYHLDNRVNKSAGGGAFDTQWLFPRDVFRGRGRAYAEEDRSKATPSFDGVWRVWKKSDPATTGMYDRTTVEYITESQEGRKYWHYFKHMLLGSEEHYYVSLLYNWERTRAFVQTLSAQSVWNTWELGLWEPSGGFQTHTHFLTLNEWDIIQGFSMRGMVFARKFSAKKTGALLDRIDEALLLNATSEAGLYWPGFYEVDTTTPGKQWVANYRKNIAPKRKRGKRHVPMGRLVGNVSQPRASTEDRAPAGLVG